MKFSEPFLEPYSRHVLICVGSFCSPDRRGRELYAQLASLLERIVVEHLRNGRVIDDAVFFRLRD